MMPLYRVQIALDGPAGIALAEALRPAMVIFDHCLPGMTGPAVMACIRKLLPTTPLLSLSSYEPLAGLYDPEPDAYLTKGDSVEAMLATVASFL